MACVELPKDAYGRAIPLDTGTLYKKNGVAKFIYHYDYDPRDKAWYVETDEGSRSVSELLLDRDDSWEKLEEDLGKIANHQTEVVCPYYDREIKDCEGCKLEGYDCSCSHAFLKDVMARIRKLRGED